MEHRSILSRHVANCGKIVTRPPVLKESDLHFHCEQNQQRIDTLIIQARRKLPSSQYQSDGNGQPCKTLPPLATEDASRTGFTADARAWERGAPNATRRYILVITIFETCLHGSCCRIQWPSCVQPDLTNTTSRHGSGSVESLCFHASLVHIECPTGSHAEPAVWLVSAGVFHRDG